MILPFKKPVSSRSYEEKLQVEADELRQIRQYANDRLQVITKELIDIQTRRGGRE